MPMPNKWTLEDALNLIRGLQKETRRYGYHLTLGGGVLNNGESQKDLDLYFLPLQNPKFPTDNPENLVSWLTKMWGPYETMGEDYGLTLETPAPILFSDGSAQTEPIIPISPIPYRGLAGRSDSPIGRLRSSAASAPLYPPPAPENIFYQTDAVEQALPAPLLTGVYKYQLKFNRRGDRIDVFIL